MSKLLRVFLLLTLGCGLLPPTLGAQGEMVALSGARLLTITQSELLPSVITTTSTFTPGLPEAIK